MMRFATALLVAALLAAPPEVVTNATVVELTKAGLSPDLIVTKIRSSECQFDTGASALVALKRAGVHESVISAMVVASSSPRSHASTEPAENADAIFLVGLRDGSDERVALAPAPHHGKFGMGYFGLGAGVHVVLPGREASVRTESLQPRIVIRTRDDHPPGYVLTRLDESDEGGGRQVDPESAHVVDWEQVEGGYRGTPRKRLKRGEYALYRGSLRARWGEPLADDLVIFDFGVGPEKNR